MSPLVCIEGRCRVQDIKVCIIYRYLFRKQQVVRARAGLSHDQGTARYLQQQFDGLLGQTELDRGFGRGVGTAWRIPKKSKM